MTSQRQPDHDQTDQPRRPWQASRRVLLKASAAFGLLAAGGAALQRRPASTATAQTTGGIRGQRWAADEAVVAAADVESGREVVADFAFTAIGASWPGSVGAWPVLELAFMSGGSSFSAPVTTVAGMEDGGPPDREGRIFTRLVFPEGATAVRYRVLDGNGAPASVPGLELVFIDAAAGPGPGDDVTAAALPTLKKPKVISRAGWGADESIRFDSLGGEIWPREYRTVEHVIIHHTDTPNGADPYAQIRSIYYYHAIEREWGDIGYNYLVDDYGRIFEGRAGGPNVVGGHAFQYNYGSSGIGTIGTFSFVDASEECQAAIIAITAWVGRNLDPLGRATFHEIMNLPTICGHRDVNPTTCPGDVLWSDLPAFRKAVKHILDSTESPPDDELPPDPAEFKDGDNVVVVQGTNLRTEPSTTRPIVQKLTVGTLGAVVGGPRYTNNEPWFAIRLENAENGWVLGRFLDPAPPGNPTSKSIEPGDRVRITIDELNVRRNPGLAQSVLNTLPLGAVVKVTRASVAANNRRWFAIQSGDKITGWVVQEGITLNASRKLTLSYTAGPVGRTVTATYSGMPASSRVSLQFNGAEVTTGSTNSLGAGSLQFRVPVQPKGNWQVRVVKGLARAYNRYEIQPRIALNPRSGLTGSQVAVSLTGYAANESIAIEWQRDTRWVKVSTVVANQLGAAGRPVTVRSWASGTQIVRGLGATSLARAKFTTTGKGPTPTPRPSATPTATTPATAEPTSPPETTTAPTSTPSPTPTPTPSPTPSPTPTPEPTSTPTPQPTPTETPAAQQSTEPTPEATAEG